MQVAKYLFHSPSTSAVQVGRLDPSSLKEDKSQSSTKDNSTLPKAALNETASKAQSFAQTQQQEVKPSVAANSIDLYV